MTSIATLILNTFNVRPHNVVAGSELSGYDIKSQDALTMLRLSLIADNPNILKEVYADANGVVTVVQVGEDVAPSIKGCISEQTAASDVPKTDHVIVRGRDPLPTRYFKPSVNATNGSVGQQPKYPSGLPLPWNKLSHLYKQVWVEFTNSPQDPVIQIQLRSIVRRDAWESLVGYIMSLPPIPAGVSFSLSSTTPRNFFIPYSGIQTTYPFTPSAPIVDVGGLSAIGAPVLDIQTGEEIASLGGTTLNYSTDPKAYYILLAHEYGLHELSRGQNWWLVPGPTVLVIAGAVNSKVRQAVGSLIGSDRKEQYFFRSTGPRFQNFKDIIDNNLKSGHEGLSSFGGGLELAAFEKGVREGLGSSLGFESPVDLLFSYTVQRPSITLKSENTLLVQQAASIATRGIFMMPIVVQDLPAPVALNGKLVELSAPFDEETNPIITDSILDNLSGSIVDITLPIFGGDGASNFSSSLYQALNSEKQGKNVTRVYRSGGYNILPGQKFGNDGVVLSVEYTYSDQNSVTTSVTTGPRYYPVQSFNDSQYVRRSETLTRRGTIVTGNNATGEFSVNVNGFGALGAFNSVMKPLYPGDSVEVRILNSPIER